MWAKEKNIKINIKWNESVNSEVQLEHTIIPGIKFRLQLLGDFVQLLHREPKVYISILYIHARAIGEQLCDTNEQGRDDDEKGTQTEWLNNQMMMTYTDKHQPVQLTFASSRTMAVTESRTS